VSHLSAYAIDGGVPLPVMSKLLAGHATIVMTLHYVNLGKNHITSVLNDAERVMLKSQFASSSHLKPPAEWQEISARLPSLKGTNSSSAIPNVPSAAIVGEDKGMCPVSASLCSVGGEEIEDTGGVHAPVPGFPEQRNCTRCRFFFSGPAFLPGLIAHFNQRSYDATQCAIQYRKLHSDVQACEDRRAQCQANGRPFEDAVKLEKLHQCFEEQAERADHIFSDLHADAKLIEQCIEIANTRDPDSNEGVRLLSVGSMSDIKIMFNESTEMHQLTTVCENATIFTGLDAGKATLRRSQILDSMLEMNGKPPLLFRLTPEQQLSVGNEMMKLIRTRANSQQNAIEFAEGRRRLEELGLLNETVSLIEQRLPPVKWGDAIGVSS
jgi:hypothetical protein